MAVYPLITQDWTALDIVPTDVLEFWHQYKFGESGHQVIYDYSGNGRHISCAVSGAPVLTTNVINGQPGWYFNGTSNGLTTSASITFDLKHLFILLKVDEATFTDENVLLSSSGSSPVLTSDASTTEWIDLGGTSTYRKNDTLFSDGDWQAPMNAFGLLEIQIPSGISLGDVTLNNDTTFKGYFVEQMGFSEVLNEFDRRRVHLHFNLRYRVNTLGVPLYFPSKDIIPSHALDGPVHFRFKDQPNAWEEITETYEYEDGGRDFNEIAGSVPYRWEYIYQKVNKAHKPIFDLFNDVARRANTFYFKDPENIVWSNVRIENYDRDHEGHKRWVHDAEFELVGHGSVGAYEAPEAPPDTTAPSVPTGLAEIGDTSTSITLGWSLSSD